MHSDAEHSVDFAVFLTKTFEELRRGGSASPRQLGFSFHDVFVENDGKIMVIIIMITIEIVDSEEGEKIVNLYFWPLLKEHVFTYTFNFFF